MAAFSKLDEVSFPSSNLPLVGLKSTLKKLVGFVVSESGHRFLYSQNITCITEFFESSSLGRLFVKWDKIN